MKRTLRFFWVHRGEYPYFYKAVGLCMLCIGSIIFVSEYVVLKTSEVIVYTVITPLGEELLKSSVNSVGKR